MFIRKKGFTLIELVLVITILGILAIVAIPRFINLRTDAERAARQGIKAAIESGAQLWKARHIIDSSSTSEYSVEYPPNWEDALDSDVTADIDGEYGTELGTDYNSSTGKVGSAFTNI
jgi:prepilin-type N-terminal cleavage/methylation domain-containing protein